MGLETDHLKTHSSKQISEMAYSISRINIAHILNIRGSGFAGVFPPPFNWCQLAKLGWIGITAGECFNSWEHLQIYLKGFFESTQIWDHEMLYFIMQHHAITHSLFIWIFVYNWTGWMQTITIVLAMFLILAMFVWYLSLLWCLFAICPCLIRLALTCMSGGPEVQSIRAHHLWNKKRSRHMPLARSTHKYFS